MAKISSTPDVYDKEIDLSEITTPVGSNVGAIVINSNKGRCNMPVLVTSDKDFIENFGQPVVSGDSFIYGYGAHAALRFLNESDSLYVIRETDPTQDFFAKAGISSTCSNYPISSIGASAGEVPDTYDNIYSIENAPMSGSSLLVAATSPGDWGNNLAITVETLSANSSDWFFSYDDIPIGVETSAISPSAMPIANQVFKLSVYKKESTESWNSYYVTKDNTSAYDIKPVEVFYGSLSNLTDTANNQLFIKDVVNSSSNLIYVDVNPNASNLSQTIYPSSITSAGENIGVRSEALIQLSGGAQGIRTGIGQYNRVWEYFKNYDKYNISIFILPDHTNTVKQALVQNVVGYRNDAVLVTQTGTINDVTVQKVWNAEKYGYTQPNQVCLYTGYGQVYDKFNSKNVYLPLSIFAAEILARTVNVKNVYAVPAGINRGILPFIKVNKDWQPEEIGKLLDRNINTFREFDGIGYVLWGSHTAQLLKSKLQQISIRRTLNAIKKSLKKSLMRYVLDVTNTPKTRLRIWSNINSYLSTVVSEEGINRFEIICDDSNNTQFSIDNNELNVDIYIDFPSPIERINLSYIVTATGVNFNEVRVR